MNYHLIFTLVFTLFIHPVFGQWESDVDVILRHPDFAGAQVAIAVTDLEGNIIYQHHGEFLLIPASTYKLVTALTAYSVLGTDFKFDTRLGISGEILADGTLDGDVRIIGSGDPSLGSDKTIGSLDLDDLLDAMTSKIVEAGIKCIEGRIIIDNHIFDPFATHDSWTWDDLSNYYASGTYGFNIHENFYRIYFRRAERPGVLTEIARIAPRIPGLIIENLVTTGVSGSGDNAYIFGSPRGFIKQVRGTIPPGKGLFSIKGAIPEPSDFFEQALVQRLKQKHIQVANVTLSDAQETEKTTNLVSIYSPPLEELIRTALSESNNLYCDSFLKRLGAEDGRQGSYSTGTQKIREHLTQLGIDPHGIRLEDGSGLSMRNRLSPFFLNEFLASKTRELGEERLLELMPRCGVDGGMKNFLASSKGQKSFWLKSGSMSGVLGYAGLMKSKKGKILTVSILCNGHDSSNRAIRRQIEFILDVLYDGYN